MRACARARVCDFIFFSLVYFVLMRNDAQLNLDLVAGRSEERLITRYKCGLFSSVFNLITMYTYNLHPRNTFSAHLPDYHCQPCKVTGLELRIFSLLLKEKGNEHSLKKGSDYNGNFNLFYPTL